MEVENLLQSLNAHKVQYVIIGATAFPVHGYSRITFDIDIFIRASQRNGEKTLNALSEAGYDICDLTVGELLKKKILFRQYVLEADIHPHVTGTTFDSVWRKKKQARIGKTPAYFASLSDLIRMKKAAGRMKDKEDLKYLEKLKKKKKASNRNK